MHGKAKQAIHACARGFSLVELLVVITLFSIVAIVVSGTLVSIIDANNKARSQEIVQSNLRVPMEVMAEELRQLKEGTPYAVSADSVTFTKQNGAATGFRKNGTAIERLVSGSWIPLTGTDVEITALGFRLLDYNGGTDSHPLLQITVSAKSGARIKVQSEFELQTTISPQYYAPIN